MAKFQSPLLGYNNNVRHKNRVFHIQTEDSGVNHPHIITHLFMDGGRILKSVKKSYAEHVGADGMNETVRGLMKEQHKAMFIALRDGQYDHLVDPNAAKPAAAAAPAAADAPPAAAPAPAMAAPVEAAVASKSSPPAAGAIVNAIEPIVAAPLPGPPAARDTDPALAAVVPSAGPPTNPDPVLVHDAAPSELAPNTIDERARPGSASRPAASVTLPEVAQAVVPPVSEVPKTTRQPAGRELTLDFDALDRASTERTDGTSSSLFHSTDLPPPPKNLFAAKEPGTGGAYRAVETDPRHDAREEAGGRSDPREEPGSRSRPPAPRTREESPAPGRAAARSNAPPPPAPPARPASDARYAPARPAAIFGSTQRPQPASLFSDELVSDKSLDEVILSYLAEDLEPPRRK